MIKTLLEGVCKIKKYYGYYNSPIGILEIICFEDRITISSFYSLQSIYRNSLLIIKKSAGYFFNYKVLLIVGI